MKEIKKLIDKAVEDFHANDAARSHMGASIIGDACLRKVWYNFRWAYQAKHQGRLHRLFDRGHEEEFRFVRYLRMAGAEVRDYSQRLMYHSASNSYLHLDWEDRDNEAWAECEDASENRLHIEQAIAQGQGPKQWGFSHHEGHFAGSSDGMLRAEWLPGGWGLAEFKTHSYKSFKYLLDNGLIKAKPEHWVQMQIYMHYLKLPWGLYLAVNKNDDDLYPEIIPYRAEIAEGYIDRAQKLIASQVAPKRLSEDPSWFKCKFCDFREICHKDGKPQKNCRSCAYAQPVENGEWRCNKYQNNIPKEYLPVGCDNWDPIK